MNPNIPLNSGDPKFVDRHDSAGTAAARWILAGGTSVLLCGPHGVGRSTELARAVDILSQRRSCLVRLDRVENMRHLTPDRMRLRIIQQLIIDDDTRAVLGESCISEGARLFEMTHDELCGNTSGQILTREVLNSVVTRIAARSRKGRVAILIDGLEKVHDVSRCRELLDALGELPDVADVVVNIPLEVVFGRPPGDALVRHDDHLLHVRAEDTSGAGADFLREVFMRHLGPNLVPDFSRELVDEMILLSGGVPRTLLQLARSTARCAEIHGRGLQPTLEDLADAAADQVDSFKRILLPGDVAAILAAEGTSGFELELDRKVRLMAHGGLLERGRGRNLVLDVHPLLRRALSS